MADNAHPLVLKGQYLQIFEDNNRAYKNAMRNSINTEETNESNINAQYAKALKHMRGAAADEKNAS